MPHPDPERAADTPPTITTDAKAQAAHVDPLRAAQAVTEMATQPNDDSAESHDAISEITHVAPPNEADLVGADITEMDDTPPKTKTDATAHVNPLSAPIAAQAAAHVAPPNGAADLGADITEMTDPKIAASLLKLYQ